MDIEVILDGGAYVTLTPTVLSRGCIHAAGPYRCDNIRIQGRGMFTNTPPNGAFRGFGAPQTEFAVEVHMERIAEQLKLDPVELRRKNALRSGDKTATGQTLRDDTSALMVLDEAVRRTDFSRKRKEFKGTNRAIGLSLFYHGAGFTGSGERNLKSKARLDLTETGVRIAVGSTEIGQGTRTMHAQIVTDALGHPLRECRGRAAGYFQSRRQRTDGRVAHLHGRRQDSRGVRRGDEGEARRTFAGRLL